MRKDKEQMDAIAKTERCTKSNSHRHIKSADSTTNNSHNHLRNEINTVLSIFAESNSALKSL
mgnify:CR=1 FL=1